ncbi:MAG: FtsX-like permease family protein, partial [Bacteroidales bacterium]|nr:FtsX-like permease family protein [Bacteroidales bacterium]
MRSYLKFLSRNKLYTAIEAAGLIVSLAFVVIISCYTWQQFSTSREAIDHQRVYALSYGQEYLSAWPGELSLVMDRVPDVEAGGRINLFGTSVTFNGQKVQGSVDLYEIDPEIFKFLPQTFISGSEDVLNDRSQVILGESFANKISPDMDPVGKTIIVRNDTCVVGGIMKENERSILEGSDIYRAFKGPDEVSTSEFIMPVNLVLIKFREGADHKQTRELIDTLVRQEFANMYQVNKPERPMTMPFRDIYFYKSGSVLKEGNKTLLYVLIAVGILLLASALFNYINLSVALAGKRSKEMAIRSTLGESRGRILWRYVSESIVFVALCMVLALLLAKALEPVFNRYMAGEIGLDVAYSPLYLAAYLLIVCLVGVISGLIPAVMTFRHDPVSIIKGEQRRQTKSVFSKVFIIIQNVITVALIAIALVMELQYSHLVNMPLGANVDNLYYISSGAVGRDVLASKPYVDKIGVSEGYPGNCNISVVTTIEGQKYQISLLRCDEVAFDMFGFGKVKDFGRPRKGSLWFTESAARVYKIDDDNQATPDIFGMIWGHLETGGIIKDFATRNASELTGNRIGMVAIDDLEGESTCVLKLNRYDSEVRAELKEIGREESIRLTGNEEYGEKIYGYIPDLIKKSMEKTRNFISLIELFMILATVISLLGLVAMSAYYAGMQTRDIAVRKVFGGTVASETRKAV